MKNCTYTKCIGCMHSMQRITNQYLCLTELSWVSLLLHVLSLESSTWLCLAENPSGKNFWKKVSLTCPLELKSVAQMIENLPVMQKTWVWSLGQEDPLEKGMATHSRILAQRIPMGSQRVGHNWATNKYTHTHTNTHTHTHTPIPSAGLLEELAAGWPSFPSEQLNFLHGVPEHQNTECRSTQASYGLAL